MSSFAKSGIWIFAWGSDPDDNTTPTSATSSVLYLYVVWVLRRRETSSQRDSSLSKMHTAAITSTPGPVFYPRIWIFDWGSDPGDGEKCCREVLWRSVVEKWCWRSGLERGAAEML